MDSEFILGLRPPVAVRFINLRIFSWHDLLTAKYVDKEATIFDFVVYPAQVNVLNQYGSATQSVFYGTNERR